MSDLSAVSRPSRLSNVARRRVLMLLQDCKGKVVASPVLSGTRRERDRRRFKEILGNATQDLSRDLGDISQPRLEEHVARFFTGKLGEVKIDGLHWIHCPLLYLICRRLRPSIVVETGVWWGFSSSFILQALQHNGTGTLYSIDLPNATYVTQRGQREMYVQDDAFFPPAATTGWLVPEELKDRWKLIVGRSSEMLPSLLKDLRQINVFCHDSEHTYENMMFELTAAWPVLSSPGAVIVDNADWGKDAFAEFGRNVGLAPTYYRDIVRGVPEYVGMIMK